MARSDTRHTAGLFDIRMIIGALLGIYGVALLLVGLIGGSSTDRQPGGASTNVWVGVALVVVSAFFIGWAVLRPTVVDDAELAADKAAAEREQRPSA